MTQDTSEKLRFPAGSTFGEMYGPAMKITDQAEADEYFEACVEYDMRTAFHSRQEAENIERQNLGYYARYYSNETRLRVERLFRCAHPVFGPVSKGRPTAAEALEAGIRDGKEASA